MSDTSSSLFHEKPLSDASGALKGNDSTPLPLYGIHRHPQRLTPSERRRFIRSYYTVWSLMIISPDLWPARLAAIPSLRELYYLTELCLLPQSIGGDECSDTDSDTDYTDSKTVWDAESIFYFDPSERREKLRREVGRSLPIRIAVGSLPAVPKTTTVLSASRRAGTRRLHLD